MIPLCFFDFISSYSSNGSVVTPTQVPLTNTLTFPCSSAVLAAASTFKINGSTYSYKDELLVGIVMCAI